MELLKDYKMLSNLAQEELKRTYTMHGLIGFENYKVSCIIGVNSIERSQTQDLYIDLKVRTNFALSIKTDNIQDTINYIDLANVCAQLAIQGNYCLLEKYAHDVLECLIATFDISWAWIRIKKRQAIPEAQYAMIELERFN